YATIADGSKGLQAVSNGGFVVGRDAAFIIEGHMHPAGAALELEALRSLTQAPVRGALNTHYHFDHTFGNAFYGAQGIPIWAHARTATLMTERYAALQGKDNSGMIAPIEKRIASAKDETTRQRAQGDLNAFRWFVSSVEGTVLALPNHPLDPTKLPMKLDLGGISVLLEAREGHSPTDIIARVPERNITFAGDLVFNGSYPVTFDADMTAWHKVMRTLAGFDKSERFVPGHGAICGQDWIAQQTAIMDDIAAQAEKLFRAGVPAKEAKQRYVVPEKFKSLNMFSWFFCIENAIADHYKSLARR
ncbi:MAG: MBL fold metallo-hydrolase, partial [Candidatus Acidiferrales bacterium]